MLSRTCCIIAGHADYIDQNQYAQLVSEHIMFKNMADDSYLASAGIASDWPYGRGCYVSQDRKFIVWVGEEDHLRIMAMQTGTVLNDVFDRLENALDVISGIDGLDFADSVEYGAVTSCPTNLGTGMRASVHVPLPKLTSDGTTDKVKEVCAPLGLSVRGAGGEHTAIGSDGTCDISPSSRFCITEAEIIAALYTGLAKLKQVEDRTKVSYLDMRPFPAPEPFIEEGVMVILDRANKAKLGMKLGNAASSREGVPILGVEEGTQAHNKLFENDNIIAINGNGVLGFKMLQAANVIARSTKVEFTLNRNEMVFNLNYISWDRIEALKQSHPNNLAMKHIDRDYYESLDTLEKRGICQCIRSGYDNPDSNMGCYAMQPADYDRFKPFFSKVLAEYHGVAEDAVHYNNWDLGSVADLDLPADGQLDVSQLGFPPLSMRVRVGRNLKDFPLPGAMNRQQRMEMETQMCTAFNALMAMDDYGGRYHSLTPGHEDNIDDIEYAQLIEEHIMFKNMADDSYLASAGIASDWPYGRGCYVSQDRKFIVWVGEEDHLRIMAMQTGTVLNDVFDRLENALDVISGIDGLDFADSVEYGAVTSCPTNLGTGMRASVHVPLPKLTSDGTDTHAKEVCAPLGLSVRGAGGEHTAIGSDGTCDISPSSRFCITEAEIITRLYKGLVVLKTAEDQFVGGMVVTTHTVTLDRSEGKKLGVRLGNAATSTEGVPILGVEPDGQAYNRIVEGDIVVSINNENALGLTMLQAASIIARSDAVDLELQRTRTTDQLSGAERAELQAHSHDAEVRRLMDTINNDGDVSGYRVIQVEEEENSDNNSAMQRTATMTSVKSNDSMEFASPQFMGPVYEVASPTGETPVYKAEQSHTITVTLDRTGGKKLGIRLGDAASSTSGVQVLSVDPAEQAVGRVLENDTIIAINGTSCIGKSMMEAAQLVGQSKAEAVLTLQRIEPVAVDYELASPKTSLGGVYGADNIYGNKPSESQGNFQFITITLDRSDGRKLGVRLGDALSPAEGVLIQSVDPNEQAHERILQDDQVIAINGAPTVGFSMQQAAALVGNSSRADNTVELSIKRAVNSNVDLAMYGDPTDAADEGSASMHTVSLDRADGRKLGVRLGDAPSPSEGVLILSVDPDEQAHGKLLASDEVVAINGESCVGFTMQQAAGLMTKDAAVLLSIKREDIIALPGSKTTGYGSLAPNTAGLLTVTLDQANGLLGVRLGDSMSKTQGVVILSVDPNEQAHGKILADDEVVAVNGESCIGFTMQQAAALLVKSDIAQLAIKRTPVKPAVAEADVPTTTKSYNTLPVTGPIDLKVCRRCGLDIGYKEYVDIAGQR